MRSKISVLIVILALLCFASFVYAQTTEEITITTYYPSPYGVYKNLRLFPNNDVQVGDVCSNAGEFSFRNTGTNAKKLLYCDGTNWQLFAQSGWYVPQDVRKTTNTNTGRFNNLYAGITDGYRGINEFVRRDPNCGNNDPNTTWHVCDDVELTRYSQLNTIPIATMGRYMIGIRSDFGGTFITNCSGWVSNGADHSAVWSSGGGGPGNAACSELRPVMCCR